MRYANKLNSILEANRYEREKMPGASSETMASERTKRRFGRDVDALEKLRQEKHKEKRGKKREGRAGDALGGRDPKGNQPLTKKEGGPRKRETRRMEHLKKPVKLPENSLTKYSNTLHSLVNEVVNPEMKAKRKAAVKAELGGKPTKPRPGTHTSKFDKGTSEKRTSSDPMRKEYFGALKAKLKQQQAMRKKDK